MKGFTGQGNPATQYIADAVFMYGTQQHSQFVAVILVEIRSVVAQNAGAARNQYFVTFGYLNAVTGEQFKPALTEIGVFQGFHSCVVPGLREVLPC